MTRVEIPDDDRRIERVAFDGAITFMLGQSQKLKIESSFILTTPNAEPLTVDPNSPGQAALATLKLLHRDIERCEHDGGDLWMDVEGGYRIFVPDDPHHEPWSLGS